MALSSPIKKILFSLIALSSLLISLFFALAYGWLGKHDGPGKITNQIIPVEIIQERSAIQKQA
ncbi:MAG: hypothetical protein OSB24_00005, partial [Woeseiaceae bacterium]|nr:hypothetical protein [Woeseiaceae bacterium]